MELNKFDFRLLLLDRLPYQVKDTSLPYFLPIAGGRIDGFIPFQRVYIFFFRGIILWIELLWPENPANIYAWHTEKLDSYFDLIRSCRQCIPWSPPLEIETATTFQRVLALYEMQKVSLRGLNSSYRILFPETVSIIPQAPSLNIEDN